MAYFVSASGVRNIVCVEIHPCVIENTFAGDSEGLWRYVKLELAENNVFVALHSSSTKISFAAFDDHGHVVYNVDYASLIR